MNSVKLLMNAAVIGLASFAANAHAGYNFNFDNAASGTSANDAAVNPYSNVQFLSGFVTADLDSDGFEILDPNGQTIPGYTHWEAYSDSDIRVRNPEEYGHGDAPSVSNALDAMFDQVLISFSSAQNLSSFSVQLDNSNFGGFNSSILFLDAAGKTLSTLSFDQYANPGAILTAGPISGVYGIVLGAGKLYDNLSITTVSAVPEAETYAMMLAGLGMMGFVASRRRR